MKHIYLLATLTAACALQMHAMTPKTAKAGKIRMTAEDMALTKKVVGKGPLYIDAARSKDGSFDVSIQHCLAVPALVAQKLGTKKQAENSRNFIAEDLAQAMRQVMQIASPEELKAGADLFLNTLRENDVPTLPADLRPAIDDPALHLALGCLKVNEKTAILVSMLIQTGHANFDALNAQGQTVFEYIRHQQKKHPQFKDYFREAREVLEDAKENIAAPAAAQQAADSAQAEHVGQVEEKEDDVLGQAHRARQGQ